jgi:hypothetical protein
MNIFVLHANPRSAAKMACDKHVVKMSLETAQMLCTVARENKYEESFLYKSAHLNHPCTRWAAESYSNWEWLCRHGLALCSEYTYRYGKTHKCEEIISRVYKDGLGPKKKLFRGMTPFAQAMPEQYKSKNAVTAYREYYLGEKKRFAKWTNRNPPKWWRGNNEQE